MRRMFYLLVVTVMAAGCSNTKYAAIDDYETRTHDPKRQTETARRLNSEGLDLLNQDELDLAEQTLKRALAADVMFGPAHNNLGKVYYHQSKMYMAAWEFQYASKLMQHQPEPRNNLGLVFEAVGKYDQAIKTYSEARDLEPDNPQLIGNLVRARIRRGDRDDDVRQLLVQLVSRDTRPEWIEWAKLKLATTSW